MADPGAHTEDDLFWHEVLSGRLRTKLWQRQLFRLISPGAAHRCHVCYAPFEGMAAPVMRTIGRGPWRRNPRFCDECERVFAEHRGGAEIEIAVLYADVRGSTPMAARMRPAEFAALMQRFFITATKILTGNDAVIDKMVGDEVIGLFFAGMVGDDDYRQGRGARRPRPLARHRPRRRRRPLAADRRRRPFRDRVRGLDRRRGRRL